MAAICARLGGLPLAIELAAPWMRTLSAADLLARIGHRLDLLATSGDQLPERHRALLGVLDGTWSWLSSEEQRTVRNLGIFVGGFSLEAAETVAGASLAALSTLTERSIIRRVPLEDDDTRYAMHEMVRQYAVDRLTELPTAEQDLVHTRHLEHLVTCTERFEAARNGPDERVWLARMHREEANVEAALTWALDRGPSEACAPAGGRDEGRVDLRRLAGPAPPGHHGRPQSAVGTDVADSGGGPGHRHLYGGVVGVRTGGERPGSVALRRVAGLEPADRQHRAGGGLSAGAEPDRDRGGRPLRRRAAGPAEPEHLPPNR